MKGKLFWIGGVVVLLLAVGVTLALANSVETYYACVNDSSGTIKMVGEDDSCKNNHTKISWNAVGPPGPQGDPGLVGPAGADGVNGVDGADGLPGADGADGLPGADGADGLPGADGADGLPGADGVDGLPGADGVDGLPGADGVDGQNCWDLDGDGVGDLPDEDINGDESVDVFDCQGPEGEAGPPGPRGPTGPQGPPGEGGSGIPPIVPNPGNLSIFLRIEGADGNTDDPNHNRWSDALGYQHQVQATSDGGRLAQVSMDDFTVMKNYDDATDEIISFASDGRVIQEVILEVCGASELGPRCFLKIRLSRSTISNYESFGQLEVIGFNFEEISWEYSTFDHAGTYCGLEEVEWNIPGGKGKYSGGSAGGCHIGFGAGDGLTFLVSPEFPGESNHSSPLIRDAIGLNHVRLLADPTHRGSYIVKIVKGVDIATPKLLWALLQGRNTHDGRIYYCNNIDCPYNHRLHEFQVMLMSFSETQVEDLHLLPSTVEFEGQP